MQKTLDTKLANLAADSACRDFILADAKDADMAFGVHGLGRDLRDGRETRRTLDMFRDQIRAISEQRLVDIMLMSVRSSDQLTIRERLFADSPVTPAIRANDTTDIWLADSAANYAAQASRPFRSATLEHAMYGKQNPAADEPVVGAELGLYSITLNHDLDRDIATLQSYADFRREAELKGFRHFLEVFAPNACDSLTPEQIPGFVNDSIIRLLAGVARPGRPVFLKIPYFGPAAMEDLASHDSSLVVGILGGAAGTSFDAFQLLWEAKKYGARAALFGRRINQAECQLSFVECLRRVADDELEPAEAVRVYHDRLAKNKITPRRTLDRDLEATLSAPLTGRG